MFSLPFTLFLSILFIFFCDFACSPPLGSLGLLTMMYLVSAVFLQTLLFVQQMTNHNQVFQGLQPYVFAV